MSRPFAAAQVSRCLFWLAACCCAFVPWGAFETRADEGRELVSAALRKDYPRGYKAFQRWLDKEVRVGRIRDTEVIAVLGRGYRNLDRPKRDGLFTLEYDLGTLGISGWGGEFLVLDFDARTRLLVARQIHIGGICGFCPHVLVDDGGWRLEGKMLAGCVGASREGVDALVLPRLMARRDGLRIRVANTAPEVEFIDQVVLGAVALDSEDELDLDITFRPFIWRSARQVEVPSGLAASGAAELTVALDARPGQVLVLEARNTAAFQDAMRQHLLDGAPAPRTNLEVQFDEGLPVTVQPVGTKFLRRIVVPIPEGAQVARITLPGEMWWIHRVWVGTGRPADRDVTWHPPAESVGPQPDAAWQLCNCDGLRLRLETGQQADLVFPLPPGGQRWGYLLKMAGYYDFLPLPDAGPASRRQPGRDLD